MSPAASSFQAAVTRWVLAEESIRSAVVFGSAARDQPGLPARDEWSDIDLHVGTSDPGRIEAVDWAEAVPGESFRFQVVRPATGGVRKATVLFAHGQIDLVLVPVARLRSVRTAMLRGRHREPGPLRGALDEMQTCLRSGYRFIKGEKAWGGFYRRVATEMAGVRLADAQVRHLADVALCDLLWILQKLNRGELAATQHLLHRSVAETNFRFARELRLRRAEPLPSFGLGRHVEELLAPAELARVQVSARLDPTELRAAAWRAFDALCSLTRDLVPSWRVPAGADALLRGAAAAGPGAARNHPGKVRQAAKNGAGRTGRG